jgi:hypothetical protein
MPYYSTVSDGYKLIGGQISKAIPQMAELLGLWDGMEYEVQIAYRNGEATLFIKVSNAEMIAVRQPLGNDEADALLKIMGR